MSKRWQPFDDSCPSCGNSPEVFTLAAQGLAYEDDDARCVECGHPGRVVVDDSRERSDGEYVAYVEWHDDPDYDCCDWCRAHKPLPEPPQ